MFNINKVTCIEDLRKIAKFKVPKMFYDYMDTGSFTETTYHDNAADFQKLKFLQKVARDLSHRSIKAKLLGTEYAMPLAIAPTGLTGMQRADGEILAAKAAEKFGVPFTLSTMSICSIEDIAEHTSQPFWFQLYVMKDRDFMRRLIGRAKDAGCSALVVTLDLQV
ncbi:MAG: alpha-hydroxy-acid oxidizing protein, partial [Alcaligenaceae bacterium]|nr:alpha-hydroxy-acid oxidizing protein [Alcaligenaceae bacterium]